MITHVLKGSKQEIAERLIQISGEVREAIVFVEEPAPVAQIASPDDREDIFDEMRPFMVEVPEVDDSREAIYSRMDGEDPAGHESTHANDAVERRAVRHGA